MVGEQVLNNVILDLPDARNLDEGLAGTVGWRQDRGVTLLLECAENIGEDLEQLEEAPESVPVLHYHLAKKARLAIGHADQEEENEFHFVFWCILWRKLYEELNGAMETEQGKEKREV